MKVSVLLILMRSVRVSTHIAEDVLRDDLLTSYAVVTVTIQ